MKVQCSIILYDFLSFKIYYLGTVCEIKFHIEDLFKMKRKMEIHIFWNVLLIEYS